MKMGITVYGAHLLVPEEGGTVSKIIQAAAHVGFDGIDLGYYWGEDRKSEFEEAKKVADGEGIAIANYIVGNNFGNAAAENRLDAEIDKVKTALEEAAYFNCPTLRVFGGGYNLGRVQSTDRRSVGSLCGNCRKMQCCYGAGRSRRVVQKFQRTAFLYQ